MFELLERREVQDIFEPPDAGAIEATQQVLGVRLDPAFREFLCRFNGGICPHPLGTASAAFGIAQLLGVGTHVDQWRRIDFIFEQRCKPHRPDLVPFALSSGSQVIAINANTQVYVLRSSAEKGVDVETSKLAESFAGFVDELVIRRDLLEIDASGLSGVFEDIVMGDEDRVIEHASDCGVDTCDATGKTLLMHAIQSHWPLIVEKLLRLGADVGILDGRGYSPLYYAAVVGSVDCVKQLLTAGAEPSQLIGPKRDQKVADVEYQLDSRVIALITAHGP